MRRPIVLHQMTALGIGPNHLPALAAAIGCHQISLFTYSPNTGLPEKNSGFAFPVVAPGMKHEISGALDDNDVSINGVEFFPITADIDVEDFARALALGRALGAKRAVTLIFDPDRSRALDKLGRLCELADSEELLVSLEFTPLTLGCVSLKQACWFVDQIGGNSLGVGVDMLHLVRSGGSAADIATLDARYFHYAQVCDGHGLHPSSSYFSEAHNRELPGKGDFPLTDILNALPTVTTLEVEVPSVTRRAAGVTSLQHAREAVVQVRAVVDTLAPIR